MSSRTPPDEDSGFPFLQRNRFPAKPRERALTEIRGPYYTVMGRRYLADLLETMGTHIDSLKFAGGSFTLMPPARVRELTDLAHEHGVLVSTGGFIESVLPQGTEPVELYIEECKRLGFDIIEVSAGFVTLPTDDWLRLIERVRQAGLRVKAEVGIQFGAGGTSAAAELAAEGVSDPQFAIDRARRFLDAGAYMVMIESEGITEEVADWRTDVPARFIDALGLDNLMFEAANPRVFQWYIRNYGPDVNLFVDHSQIIELAALRAGIWGPKSLWRRVVTYRPERSD